MYRFAHELRHARRRLARSPVFSLTALLVLTLGIGAGTAVFGVVDHVLFRPLELPGSQRLMRLCESHPAEGCFGVAPPAAADWSREATSFEAIGLARGAAFRMREEGRLLGVRGGLATPGLFRALGVAPFRGRFLEDRDMPPAGPAASAVISYDYWQSELGADPAAVGRVLMLDDHAYTVVGVLPRGASVPGLEWARVWLPLPFDPSAAENRDWRGFRGYGRLRPGVSPERAEAELAAIQAARAEAYPEAVRGWSAGVTPWKEVLVGRTRPLLVLLAGAVAVVLLIVCVNLAALFLARATSREPEMAVRHALGAGGATLVAPVLAEVAILSAAGGAAGLLAAFGATRLFVALAPPGVPRLEEVAMDARIAGFGVAITAVTALLFGVLPALRLRGRGAALSLRQGHGGSTGRRAASLRRALVVAELALALMLVLSTGLLLRSFGTLARWDPGFETSGLLTFQVYPSSARFPDDTILAAFYREARDRLAALPGVRSVGSASAGPLFGGSDGATPFLVQGRPAPPLQDAPRLTWYDAGPGYFPTLGVEPVEGRNIEESDRLGSTPVALINETAARRYWPDGSPVGAHLSLPQWGTDVDVVGVVPDTRPFLPDEAPQPAIYVSNRQAVRGASFYILRTDGDPEALATAVRRTLTELDSELEPVDMRSMEQRLGAQLVGPRFNMLLMGIFALVALVLGAAGLYGVVAYTVALRTREMGIRMALGAVRRDIVRYVMGDAFRLLLAGLVLGLAGAALFARLLTGLLHGVSPTDPRALLATVALLLAAGLLAALSPALRASRTDPMRALKVE